VASPRARQALRTGLAVSAIAVIGVLAQLSPDAGATGRGRIAAACSHQTVNGGTYVGTLTLRLVLLGRVSCAAAHRLVRAYYNKMAAGRCGKLNNFCNLQFSGGWDCSIFFYTESQATGGAIAGCARSGARIRLYKTGRTR
jgi:hypothetical protein